jgi:hypothetical protein
MSGRASSVPSCRFRCDGRTLRHAMQPMTGPPTIRRRRSCLCVSERRQRCGRSPPARSNGLRERRGVCASSGEGSADRRVRATSRDPVEDPPLADALVSRTTGCEPCSDGACPADTNARAFLRAHAARLQTSPASRAPALRPVSCTLCTGPVRVPVPSSPKDGAANRRMTVVISGCAVRETDRS